MADTDGVIKMATVARRVTGRVRGVRMPYLVGGEPVLQAVHQFRSVWVKGRYGGGKTLLSVVLAHRLAERYGYEIASNIPVTGGRLLKPSSAPPKSRTVVLFDEAWLALGEGVGQKRILQYMAFLRKQDLVLLMPSVLELGKKAFYLWIRRRYNFGVFGIPLWVYEWGMRGAWKKKDISTFMMWFPQRAFGSYDTLAQPEQIGVLFDCCPDGRQQRWVDRGRDGD